METAIINQNPHWSGQCYQDLFHREVLHDLIKKCNTQHIQALSGIRRCGKSSLFRLLINHLMTKSAPKSILFLNMDDPMYYEVWNNPSALYGVIEHAEKITGTPVRYLFLDEVQSVQGWERFVKSVYDSQQYKKIMVTGSNSSLLENDFSSLLSGRYFSNTVYPLSFKEVLTQEKITDTYLLAKQKTTVLRLLDDCMNWGCFPEILQLSDVSMRRELLKNYFDSIVMKDCIYYQKIADVHTFKQLLLYALSNAGSVFSYNSIGKAIGSNENTVKKYITILNDSYIMNDVLNFSFSLKATVRNWHKLYAADNGLMNALSYIFSDNKGKLLENFVFTELKKRGCETVTFMKKENECDFIIQEGKQYHAIQVCYQLTPENRTREYNGFTAVEKQIKLASKHIITYNQSEKLGDIEVVPVWEYFGR
jgi:predicted AAA+ superfamily ATPase